jgi:hypothetical protein
MEKKDNKKENEGIQNNPHNTNKEKKKNSNIAGYCLNLNDFKKFMWEI